MYYLAERSDLAIDKYEAFNNYDSPTELLDFNSEEEFDAFIEKARAEGIEVTVY